MDRRTDRRGFLRIAAGAGPAALAAACTWDGGDLIRPRLLSISRLNDWVGEKILFSPTRLAPTYDPASWRLTVDGLVEQPLSLSLDDLYRMPRASYTVKHHCVEGWSAIASWAGVPVSEIVLRARPKPAARYIMFRS